ncbi:hypothetical protein MLD38_006116 [Melastoma candidum]|uniref:Uncharacterized protein n=1 Tax=Melastoma candidum TaxID=119954 RepID=A0ACB9RLW4_9MYRT|nr:hypothetical protein MLD38_006116 [Melastoma candidum]
MASGSNHEKQRMVSFFVTRVEIVHSEVPNPEMILRMSSLDRQCPLLFFYERNKIPPSRLFDDLRSSLEETLSVWHPAAGRCVLVDSLTTVKILELGNLSCYNKFLEKLVDRHKCSSRISQMPLLVAEVTHFECGGFSIGIGTSHLFFDGPAALDFLCSWSANSTSTKGNCNLQKPKSRVRKRKAVDLEL